MLFSLVSIWHIRHFTFVTLFLEVETFRKMLLKLVHEDFLTAVLSTRLLFELALFLMLQCLLIGHPQLLQLVNLLNIKSIKFEICVHAEIDGLDLLVSRLGTIRDGAEESPIEKFAFDVSVELIVSGSLALERTLIAALLLLLPQIDASLTKRRLATGALHRLQQDFVAYLAFEVVVLFFFVLTQQIKSIKFTE